MDLRKKQFATLLLTAAAFSWLIHHIAAEDPCEDHVQIESSHRSFDLGVTHQPISDKKIIREDLFYRFTGGNKNSGRILDIASRVGLGKCGTKWPIFLETLHPKESSSEAFACEVRSSPESQGHCENRYRVDVIHCDDKDGDFFVYKLETPVTSEAAYCIDFRPLESVDSHRYHNQANYRELDRPFEDNFLLLVASGRLYQIDIGTQQYYLIPVNDYIGVGECVDYHPQGKVIWSDDSNLNAVELHGNGIVRRYYTTRTGCAVDIEDSRMYFSSPSQYLWRMQFNGGGHTWRSTSPYQAGSMSFDAVERILYWLIRSNFDEFVIQRSIPNLGNTMETLTSINTSNEFTYFDSVGITVDAYDKKLYWVYGNTVEMSDLVGENRQIIYQGRYGDHEFVDLTSDTYYLYIADWNANWVWRMHKKIRHLEPFGPGIFGWIDAINTYTSKSHSENSVNVTCNNANFEVTLDVARFISQYPDINPEHLTLGYVGCPHDGGATKNGSLVWSYAYTDCDTERKVANGKVWYMNKLLDQFTDGIIIRDMTFSMNVTCVLDQDVQADISFEAIDEHIKGETIVGNGEFTLTMNFYTDNTFAVPITDVPVKILLGKPMYVQLELQDATDPALTLVHQDTVASPNVDFQEGATDPHYYLVKNRCPEDETTELHSSNATQLRYSFTSFRFLRHHPSVYLHTYVKVCDPEGSPGASCQRICLTSSHHRAARAADAADAADAVHRVFNGPLTLSENDEEFQFGGDGTKEASSWRASTWIIVFLAGCIIVSLSLLYMAKKMRQDPGKKRSISSREKFDDVKYMQLIE